MKDRIEQDRIFRRLLKLSAGKKIGSPEWKRLIKRSRELARSAR